MAFNGWTLHWASWGEFLAMGGYAFYVWGSFLACVFLLLWECLQAKSAWSKALEDLEQFYELEGQRFALKAQVQDPSPKTELELEPKQGEKW